MKLAPMPLLALALASTGCAAGAADRETLAQSAPDWRSIATSSDRQRLREWRTAWTRGLQKAQSAGYGGSVEKEGTLLQPDSAIGWQDPPAGTYLCRTIKVGGKTQGMLDYVAYPAFHCRIRNEDGLMSFAKLDGSQRPIGLILPYVGDRKVFLGTLQLGDETRTLEYGRDQDRDLAGVLERIGDRRWRLVLPYPHFESTIDVIELVPASG